MPIPSCYQPLFDYLIAVGKNEIILTVPEIEAILGAALPPSASTSRGYWSSASNNHVRMWKALGWSAYYDHRRGLAIFTRDAREA